MIKKKSMIAVRGKKLLKLFGKGISKSLAESHHGLGSKFSMPKFTIPGF